VVRSWGAAAFSAEPLLILPLRKAHASPVQGAKTGVIAMEHKG